MTFTAFGLVAPIQPSYEVHYVAPFSTKDIEVYIQRYKDVLAERIASWKSTEIDELTCLWLVVARVEGVGSLTSFAIIITAYNKLNTY